MCVKEGEREIEGGRKGEREREREKERERKRERERILPASYVFCLLCRSGLRYLEIARN